MLECFVYHLARWQCGMLLESSGGSNIHFGGLLVISSAIHGAASAERAGWHQVRQRAVTGDFGKLRSASSIPASPSEIIVPPMTHPPPSLAPAERVLDEVGRRQHLFEARREIESHLA
jgi:hypothetical protein